VSLLGHADRIQPGVSVAVLPSIAIKEQAPRVTRDPCSGLQKTEFFERGYWSTLGYMMTNGQTLGGAFEKSMQKHAFMTVHASLAKMPSCTRIVPRMWFLGSQPFHLRRTKARMY
jgi:hypothetical protein